MSQQHHHHHGGRRGRGRGGRGRTDASDGARPVASQGPPPPTNPQIEALFVNVRAQLDDRHDRYERLVKASRDLTIESKRLIFGLHRGDAEWKAKQDQIINTCLQRLALILKDTGDQWLYARAFSPGLQEFIEAASLAKFLADGTLIDYGQVVGMCEFSFDADKEHEQSSERVVDDSSCVTENVAETKPSKDCSDSDHDVIVNRVQLLCPYTDYLLGLGDLTGELMRHATYKLNGGDVIAPGGICAFVREVFDAFTLLGSAGLKWKDMNQKVTTMRQSLNKIEQICYLIHLRSSEVPKERLGQAIAMSLAGHGPPAAGPQRIGGEDEGIGDEF